VQCWCVLNSARRIDPIGHKLRQRRVLHRRKYSIKRPNSLWHLDRHHKLIQWGIVIHGIVNG
ncbi:hypothetical protein BDQ17DRAFT_1179150, partial [Cyathus striatus]